MIKPMPSFSQMRDMYRLQREAKKVKKELAKIHVEAEASGVKVVVTAEQEVIAITIDPSVPRDQIPAFLKEAFNRALKKAQVVASEKMQGVMSEAGLSLGQ